MQLYHINSHDDGEDLSGQRQNTERPFLIIGIHSEVIMMMVMIVMMPMAMMMIMMIECIIVRA